MDEEELRQLLPPPDAMWQSNLEQARVWGSAAFQGVALTNEQVRDLVLAALRKDGDEQRGLLLRCQGVYFPEFLDGLGPVALQLNECLFDEDMQWTGTFSATHLNDVTFRRSAGLDGEFRDETTFENVRFSGGVTFAGSRFTGDTYFRGIECHRRANFEVVQFDGPRTTFGTGLADVETQTYVSPDLDTSSQMVLERRGRQVGTTFEDVSFAEACFRGVADIHIEEAKSVQMAGVELSRATVTIEEAERVSLVDAKLLDEGNLRIRANNISISGARFDGPISLSLVGDLVADFARFTSTATLMGPPSEIGRTTRLLSLREAEVGNLTLGNVDLSLCLFRSAHGLAELTVDPTCSYGSPPPTRWFTNRAMLIEEHIYRAAAGKPGWPDIDSTPWERARVPVPSAEPPAALATLYRSLRLSREGRKDEPGAADFYYGEMEMRKLASRHWSADRVLLTVYWASSGYALRAWRAFAMLGALCLAFASTLMLFGLHESVALTDLLIFTLGTSTRVSTNFDKAQLTSFGELLYILLGALGPVLFGLALLSLRGRLKR